MNNMTAVSNLTPREIVSELDKYIIGQDRAKKVVAIALRNRWRRANIEDKKLRNEILPKNILMSGPTGVGKTEIARRLAQIADAPFIKVEATKFTEVGYVGRDVESVIKDLVKNAINMKKRAEIIKVMDRGRAAAEEKILNLLNIPDPAEISVEDENFEEKKKRREEYRKKAREKLHSGEFNEQIISITTEDKVLPVFEITSGAGLEEMDVSIRDMMGNMFPGAAKKQKKMKVGEAIEYITELESQKMLDMDKLQHEALLWAEESGIVFIDEIDKIVSKSGSHGPDVSREGVQRDFLPIVEGSTVNTKYGSIKTDHILFIAAGAFHMTSPSDLIPELQGRFPLTVDLNPLSQDDFEKILTEPANSLVKQYTELMKTEQITLVFVKTGIKEIARLAFELNSNNQDIGARRLQMVMETLLEEVSYSAPEMRGKEIKIDEKFISKSFKEEKEKEKLNNYII